MGGFLVLVRDDCLNARTIFQTVSLSARAVWALEKVYNGEAIGLEALFILKTKEI